MASISMKVTLSQVDSKGNVTEAPYTQSISARAGQKGEGDVLYSVAKKVQKFASDMEARAQKFKEKHGARPSWAFKATKPIRIRVAFDSECIVDTDRYCAHGGIEYSPTLKKMSGQKGLDMLMDSFHLCNEWSQPVVWKKEK